MNHALGNLTAFIREWHLSPFRSNRAAGRRRSPMLCSAGVCAIGLAGLSVGICPAFATMTTIAGQDEQVPTSVDQLQQRAEGETTTSVNRSIPLPPSLEGARIEPIDLSAHPEARLSLVEAAAKIREQFEASNPPALDPEEIPEPDDDAFRQCELLYVKAREEYLNDDYFSSIQTAEQALRYDRHAVPVLRLLAHNYLETTGKAQALLYYRRILNVDPYDDESLMRVATTWLEQGRDIDAAEYFSRLLLKPDENPPAQDMPRLRVLEDYNIRYAAAATLGDLLASLGYTRAAIESWDIAADVPSELSPSPQFQREISAALLRRGAILLQQGDAYLRMNQPERALESYRRATEYPLTNPETVLPRRVYAHLVLGHRYTAMQTVLESLLDADAQVGSFEDLLVYLRQFPESELLASAIAELAGRQPDSLSMVLAGATLLPDEKSIVLVEDFLTAHPDRSRDRLRLLQWAEQTGGTERATRLLLSQREFIGAQPDQAASEFLEIVGRDPAIVDAWNELRDETRRRRDTRMVFSQMLSELGRYREAENVLRDLLAQQPNDLDTTLTLAETLIDGGQLTEARRVLFDARNDADTLEQLAGEPKRAYRAAGLYRRVGDEQYAQSIFDEVRQKWITGDENTPADVGVAFDRNEFAVRYARFLLEFGRTEQAVSELRDALDDDPDAVPPLETLLEIYGTEGPDLDARRYREYLQILLRSQPDARPIRLLRAQQEAAAGRHDRAIAALKSLLEEDWSDNEALAVLVREWIESDQFADGIRWVERARADRPGHLGLLQAQIDLLVQSGQAERAIEILRELLDRNPYDDEISSRLVSVLRRMGRMEESLEARAERLALRPESVERRILQANLAIDREQYDEAFDLLESAIELAGDDLPFHLDRVIALADKLRAPTEGANDDRLNTLVLGAIRTAWSKQQAHPERPPSTFSPYVFQTWLTASLNVNPDNGNDVRSIIRGLMEDQPESAAAIIWMFVQDLEEDERLVEADRVVDAWLDITDPSKWGTLDARVALWRVLRTTQLDEPELALRIARYIHEAGHLGNFIRPGTTSGSPLAEFLYTQVSPAFYAEGHIESYEVILGRILEMEPDHAGANNDLGYAWADRGERIPEAEQMILKAYRQDPTNHAYIDSIAWLRYKQGRFTDLGDEPEQLGAVSLLRQASSHREGRVDPVILDHLGDALWRSGATDEAVNFWQSAVDAYRSQLEEMKVVGEEAAAATENAYGEVAESAESKVKAVESGGSPAVAPLANE